MNKQVMPKFRFDEVVLKVSPTFISESKEPEGKMLKLGVLPVSGDNLERLESH